MTQPIYLDHHATTPTDKRVLEAMLPYFCEEFGNVGSQHLFGKSVKKACEQSRLQVAKLINASAEEVVFTSGATESNNLAIKGIAEALKNRGRHIITCSIEHKAVLDCCAYLESQGYEVTYLKPNRLGMIDLKELENSIRTGAAGSCEKTILISLMGANNEIGVVNPVEEIGKLAKAHGIIFHCDGAQTVGKIPFDVKRAQVDLLSMSGHKIYGPKGIGTLYVSRDNADLSLVPLFHGGGQECGMRSGTLPVPLVVGMGKACEIAMLEMSEENARLLALRQYFWQQLKEKIQTVSLNGHESQRLPGNLNVCFKGIDSEFLGLAFKNIAVSQSSACSAGSPRPSYVLRQIGLSESEAFSSVRFGLGKVNTESDVDFVVLKIAEIYQKFGDRFSKKKVDSSSLSNVKNF